MAAAARAGCGGDLRRRLFVHVECGANGRGALINGPFSMADDALERVDWRVGRFGPAPHAHVGDCGQVVVVMLWPATNHTEFKLYAFSFNTHHAPETAAEAVVTL